MPDKRVKARLGDTVVIEVTKRKKKAPAKKAEDRRYGPPPIIDEDELRRRGKFTTIYFLNQQSKFNQVPQFDSIPPERELRYQHEWYAAASIFANLSLGKNIGVRRYSNSVSFVTYRQAFDKHPLPYSYAEDYGVSLKLNGVEKPLSLLNPEWIAYSPYDTLADLLERQANGETGLETQITNAELEVEEWEAAYGSAETFWIPINTDWHRNYGYYRKKITRKTRYAVESTGNFEPFDPFDTVNYKVTQGAFADPEVAAPRLSNRTANDLRFGLLPKYWDISVTYFSWWWQAIFTPGVDSRIWKRANTVTGISTAPTLPYFDEGQPGFDVDDANKITIGFSEFSGGINGTISHPPDEVLTITGVPAPIDADLRRVRMELLGPFSTPYIMPEIGAHNDAWVDSDPEYPGQSREMLDATHATIAITEKDRAVGDLVGLFSINGQTFYVYRKTMAARGSTVFSGGWDTLSVAKAFFVSPAFDDYNNPYQSRTDIDFNYFDPGNLYDHLTE